MANDLSIKIDVNFEEYNKIETKLKSKINELEKNVKANIQFDSSQINQLENQLKKIQTELNKHKIKLDIDDKGLQNVNTQLKSIKDNASKLLQAKLKIVDGQETERIEKINNGLLETVTITKKLKNEQTSTVISQDYAKVQKELYTELNTLQKKEFEIKQQLIGADEKKTTELKKQLSIINQQKSEQAKDIVENNLKDSQENLNLLRNREKLQSNLNIKTSEYLRKEEETTQELKRQIELYKQRKEIDIQNLKSKYGSLVDNKEIESFKRELNSLSETNFSKGKLENQFNQLEANIKGSSKALKMAQKDAIGFKEEVSLVMQKFASWYVLGNAFMAIPHLIQDGTKFAVEFNKQLNEISIVTGNMNIDKLAKDFSKLGNELSSTQKDIASGAVEFYRQGLNQAEVLERLTATTKFAKVSNLDFKESAELLTATVNSLNVPIEKAVDTFTYLGDATATGKMDAPLYSNI